MSEREKMYQLLDTVPDSKISYVIGYIQGLTAEEHDEPNAETIAAMQELENGGECFDTLDELWKSLEE